MPVISLLMGLFGAKVIVVSVTTVAMIQTATTMSKRPSPSPRIVAGSVLLMKATKKSSTHSGGYKLDIIVSTL